MRATFSVGPIIVSVEESLSDPLMSVVGVYIPTYLCGELTSTNDGVFVGDESDEEADDIISILFEEETALVRGDFKEILNVITHSIEGGFL